MIRPWKPSRQQILASNGKTVPDLIAPGLKVLFSGINPSLYSAAVGHHFARPGNRFWPALHAAGFTPKLFSPFDGPMLLELGYGITNVVDRATASADELSTDELVEGGRRWKRRSWSTPRGSSLSSGSPPIDRPSAGLAPRSDPSRRRSAHSKLWVLPNPSGLNAHYRLADLARLYGELREAAQALEDRPQL